MIQGYRKVDESLKGEYAFIHDAQEIRYMYYQVCWKIKVKYSVRRLIGSLWANLKVITITEWIN